MPNNPLAILHSHLSSTDDSSKPKRGLARLAGLVKNRVSVIRSVSNKQSTTAIENASAALRPASQLPLSPTDTVMAMQLWNKVLAFQAAFAEAVALQWRVECCYGLEGAAAATSKNPTTSSSSQPNAPADSDTQCIAAGGAIVLIETNRDPLARALGARLSDLPDIALGFLDAAIRSASPHSQTVQREAYRPLSDQCTLDRVRGTQLTLECENVADFCIMLAACGFPPRSAVALVRATLWAVETHTPYKKADDSDDIALGMSSSIGKVVIQHAAVPLLSSLQKRLDRASDPMYCSHLPAVWRKFSDEERNKFGEDFYRNLLSCHPDLLDYFSRTDMDTLAFHLAQSLDYIFRSSLDPMARGSFRPKLERLANVHRRMSVPTRSYPLMGAKLAEAFQPYFERIATLSPSMSKAEALRSAFLSQYRDVMSVMHFPIRRQERLLDSAREFMLQVKEELGWTDSQLEDRLLSIETEVIGTGTYTHTTDELRVGARLSWRNSAKCIGRISWNTLEVRDCRHIDDAEGIFKEVGNHLRIATAGTNIKSVMTVFRPQAHNEALGTRFWSSQFILYAAYKDENTGEVLGDVANLELTDYLLKNKLWTPPEPRTAHDVLPLVLKRSGEPKPYIHQIPQELTFEVNIEHPSIPEITALGYKWSTVPAICNFKMTLGGVVYQNLPFNGWFMSTEIVRNLMERYDAGPAVAKACGIITAKDPFWRQQVSLELERAVLHSFKKNGYTIVDPASSGQSFCTHVQREREQFGRECPAQWSWIGGLVGPTNPTWHLEMRDFLVNPQYDYCINGLLLHTAHQSDSSLAENQVTHAPKTAAVITIPRVLIAYGSETGNAEYVARTLKRELRMIKPKLYNLNDVAGLDIVAKEKITHVLCVCSTFGTGSPPSNAKLFFEKDIALVEGVKFSVLGLGSTMYPDFCQAGVLLDNKLEVAGLDRLCMLTKVDEAAGSEDDILKWLKLMKNLVITHAVEERLGSRSELSGNKKPIHRIKWTMPDAKMQGQPEKPLGALCLMNEELLPDLGEPKGAVRKIKFEAPSAYVTGDHVSVRPLNSDENVRKFLMCFEHELRKAVADTVEQGSSSSSADVVERAAELVIDVECLEDDEVNPAGVSFPTPAKLGQVLKENVDLSLSSKSVVELATMINGLLDELFETIGSSSKADLMENNARAAELESYCATIVSGPSGTKSVAVDEFVARFPSLFIFLDYFSGVLLGKLVDKNGVVLQADPLLSLAEILVALPRLQPRYYSISSSNTVSGNEITLTVGVLQSKTSKGEQVEGVCSNYLSSLVAGKDRVQLDVKTSTFRLPTDNKRTVVMIGAGTGLSPLMGFLEERATIKLADDKIGNSKLFFGCRTENHFIYKELIRKYEKDGVTELHLALSRPSNTKKQYVQDRVDEMDKVTFGLLQRDDVHFYICGDARMAEGCFEACIKVLRRNGGMSRVSAVRHIKRLRAEGRWQTDVWGIVSNQEEAKKAVEKSRRAAAAAWMATFHGED